MSRDAAVDKTVVLDMADIALPLERAPLLMTNGWLKWLERDWSPCILPQKHSIFSWTIYEVCQDVNSNHLWLSNARHFFLLRCTWAGNHTLWKHLRLVLPVKEVMRTGMTGGESVSVSIFGVVRDHEGIMLHLMSPPDILRGTSNTKTITNTNTEQFVSNADNCKQQATK